MYAVAVNGSPRKGGNTETLLRKVLAPLEEAGWKTRLVQAGGRDLGGCIACYKCFEKKDRLCHGRKDHFNEINAELLAADAVILGTPTYFTDVSAELKGLLDRAGLVSIANGGALKGKIGAAVVAVRRGGGTHAFDTINHMYLMSQMIVPGSIYWNLGYGLERKDVEKDAEAGANMAHLGKVIAWLGAATVPARADYPKPAPGYGGEA